MVTSGQVASIAFNFRSLAIRRISGETPWAEKSRLGWVYAKGGQAQGLVAALPGNVGYEKSRAQNDSGIFHGLKYPLSRNISALGHGIGVGSRDHDVRLEKAVGFHRGCRHRVHDRELHKHQHVCKSHTGQSRRKTGSAVGQLQPADWQPPEQCLQ